MIRLTLITMKEKYYPFSEVDLIEMSSERNGVVSISIMKSTKRINFPKTINGIFPLLSIDLLNHSPRTGIHHFVLFLFTFL